MPLTIRNATVRIVDLLEPGSISLAGMNAENVTFLGPAVLLLRGELEFNGKTALSHGPEATYWDIPEGRNVFTGVIDVCDAKFTDCSFMAIGFAGRHDTLQWLAERTRV